MAALGTRKIEQFLGSLDVLVVDDNQHTRKIVRNLLTGLGVHSVRDAADGIAGLEAIRHYGPDVVIVDWEMPMLSGPEMVRMVRKPESFSSPDVPIIMMTGHTERWRILESQRMGVHEFMAKPISGKVILEKLMSIFVKPRPFIHENGYYGPAPRQLKTAPAAGG